MCWCLQSAWHSARLLLNDKMERTGRLPKESMLHPIQENNWDPTGPQGQDSHSTTQRLSSHIGLGQRMHWMWWQNGWRGRRMERGWKGKEERWREGDGEMEGGRWRDGRRERWVQKLCGCLLKEYNSLSIAVPICFVARLNHLVSMVLEKQHWVLVLTMTPAHHMLSSQTLVFTKLCLVNWTGQTSGHFQL